MQLRGSNLSRHARFRSDSESAEVPFHVARNGYSCRLMFVDVNTTSSSAAGRNPQREDGAASVSPDVSSASLESSGFAAGPLVAATQNLQAVVDIGDE